MLSLRFQKEVRILRTSFFTPAAVSLLFFVALTETTFAMNAVTTAKIEKARERVLKGDRTGAIKSLRELSPESFSASAGGASKSSTKPKAKSADPSHELAQAWLEIAEVFLTDKGQNQFSLAESIWLTKPKDALELLTPLLKAEDGNIQVSRLGARSALRILDCVRADAFVQQVESFYPIGSEVKLLRLQTQDCSNGANSTLPSLKLSPETEPAELEGAYHLLAIKDALRKKDEKSAQGAISSWENSKTGSAANNPEFWYWKWKVSTNVATDAKHEAGHDRTAARKYLRLCSEMTPRRRKNLAAYPELCQSTETVESALKSSDKAGT